MDACPAGPGPAGPQFRPPVAPRLTAALLQEVDAQARDVLARSRGGAALLRLDGRVLAHAGGAAGLPPPVTGRPWCDLWSGAVHDLAAFALYQASTGRLGSFCVALRSADAACGIPLAWDVSVAPVYGRAGDGGRPLARFITGAREASEAWRSGQRRRAVLIDAAD